MNILSGGLSLGKAGGLASCLFMPFPFPLACFCLFSTGQKRKNKNCGRTWAEVPLTLHGREWRINQEKKR